MGVSSVRRWVKHFKDGNTDIADQPRCCRPRTAATERNKQKSRRAHQTRPKDNIQRNCSATWSGTPCGPGDGEDFGISESLFPLGSPFAYRYRGKHKTAGNCSPIHPTIRMWPPQTTTCSDPWKITWEVTTTRLTRQSRKPWEAGCQDLERTLTAEAVLNFATLAEMHRSGWILCRKVTKYVYSLLTSFIFVRIPSFHCRINVLISFGTSSYLSNSLHRKKSLRS
jgi:hypothetical protein